MFLRHFELTEDPFGVTPDPKFLYFGQEHREALASLFYSVIESRAFAVMVAPPGMGKTTLLHYLRTKIQGQADTASLVCSFDDKNELLQAVMAALGVETENASYFQNWRRFQNFLIERQGQGRKVVLICDEAQSFSDETLENIRLLSNLETTQTKLLQIILAGQPVLVQKLKASQLEQLGQRISVFCSIHPLHESEVETYIEHRLQVAGRTKQLFKPEALPVISRFSRGIPRNINTICYNAMALAWSLDCSLVDEELVVRAIRDVAPVDLSGDSACRFWTRQTAQSPALQEPAAPQDSPPAVHENRGPKRVRLPLRVGMGRVATLIVLVPLSMVIALGVKVSSTGAPTIQLEGEVKGIGQSTPLKFEVRDSRHRIKAVQVEVCQRTRTFTVPLDVVTAAPAGTSSWEFWFRHPESRWGVTTQVGRRQIPDLQEGRATLHITALNDSWGDWFRGGRTELSLDLPVRFARIRNAPYVGHRPRALTPGHAGLRCKFLWEEDDPLVQDARAQLFEVALKLEEPVAQYDRQYSLERTRAPYG